VAKDTESAA